MERRATLLASALLGFGALAPRVRAADSCQDAPTIQLSLQNCTFAVGQSDVSSWGIHLGVGNDGSQLCAMPSTVVNDTLLMSSEVCDQRWLNGSQPAQCLSRKGGYISQSKLPPAPIDGLADNNPGWRTLMKVDTQQAFQYAVQAPLQLRDQQVTFREGIVSEGLQHTTSHLGLAEKSTLLQSLKDAGLIGAKSWGLNSGSQSYSLPRDGSLVLGGYDQSSIDGDFHFTRDIIAGGVVNQRPCPLQITLSGLTLTVDGPKGAKSNTYAVPASKVTVCLEPYDNLFRFPTSYTKVLKEQLLVSYVDADKDQVSASSYSGIRNLEPGLVFPSKPLAGVTMTLRATLDNGLTVIVPTHELLRPLRGLDQSGTPQVDTNLTEIAIYDGEAPEDAIVLGKAFLSTLYLFVDYETMKFKLAKQNQGAGVPLVKSSVSCTAQSTLSTPEKGLIAGLAVLGALVLGFFAYRLYKFLTKERPSGKPKGALPAASTTAAGGGGTTTGKGPIVIPAKQQVKTGRT